MKKIKTILLILMLCITFIFGSEAMSFFNNKNNEFKFENYKTPEEVQARLLELYPVGSDIIDIKNALENTKAKCVFSSKEKVLEKPQKEGDTLFCSFQKGLVFSSTEWRVVVDIAFPSKDKIANIKVYKFFHTI